MTQHYDPNQPRVSAGHHDGGQWTGGGSSPGIAKRVDPEPHGLLDAILGPHDGDGRDGIVQLAFLDPHKPPAPIQLPQPKPAPRIPLVPRIPTPLGGPYLGAALALYSLLSGLNDDEQQTIIAFKSREFRKGSESFDLEGVQILTWEEVEKICGKRFKKVQEFTDNAFDEVKKEGKPLSPSQFGTEVHKRVENKITELGDENLEAEISFAKGDGKARRGAEDTVRLDVFNRVNEDAICIDDIKTGRSGLGYDRMRELVASVSRKEKNVKRIIVTEVRPKGMRPPKPRPPTLQSE